jgi:hypothetical protein
MKLSFVSAACALALSALISAHATPLVIGGSVNVGDTNNNAFTPSPVAGDTGGLSTNLHFQLNNSTTAQHVSAGLFVLDQRPVGSTGDSGWSQLLAFCLEPDVFLTPFNNPYTVKSLAGAGYTAVSGAISELWGRYFGLVTDDNSAAAFQVALWELTYGSTDKNLATGDFKLTTVAANSLQGKVQTKAQGWLDSLNGQGPMAQGLVALQDNGTPGKQDLLTQGQVPEPGMLGLLAAGLAGLGLARRRARRNHQA